MSYHIYKTEGFIVGSVPVGEANRLISVYTEELGLVRGMAQGVRNLRSKLKHSLQDLFYTKISFVRGKDIWRIVNAERLPLVGDEILTGEKKVFIAKVALLLRRFVKGEGRDETLFNDLRAGLNFLKENILSESEMKKFELIFVLRFLGHLGYGPYESHFTDILSFTEWSSDLLNLADGKENDISSIINRAMTASHL
ncbi:MAG: repair protein RecO protein [Parcubacteria group bacterium GW2011_GWF2_38_76]|nr:MAG: repair protein RecO protein [Parcubacteria group bacterium GW2011_GWF2_38_76]HBM45861.1 DNA repair protein RecO [Patescibacteria group bacterium]